MNYWERHIGDYARDAGHLSMLEHGAYTLLLDRYYSTEQQIPAEQAHRICRARTKEERAAVDAVLAEFFTLEDGQWKNGRTEREIAKAQVKINAARTNGAKGGRPKAHREETQHEPSGFSSGSVSVTQQKAHQTPDTRHQTPVEEKTARKRAAPLAQPPDVDPQVWADWLQLRRGKRAPVTATVLDGAKSEAMKAGMTLDAFLRVWCRRGSQGLEADWLRPNERGTVVPLNKQEAIEARNRAVAAAWAQEG